MRLREGESDPWGAPRGQEVERVGISMSRGSRIDVEGDETMSGAEAFDLPEFAQEVSGFEGVHVVDTCRAPEDNLVAPSGESASWPSNWRFGVMLGQSLG